MNDSQQISLAYLPPTQLQTRSALGWTAALLVGFTVLTPIAHILLRQTNGFVPAVDALIFVTDLITAGLLYTHYSITRSSALLALACGYLFSALMVVAEGLTFPGAFYLSTDLGSSARFNFRIYMFWHLGLPFTLYAYVWLRDRQRVSAAGHSPGAAIIVCSIAAVAALVGCFVWLAAVGDAFLRSLPHTSNPFIYPGAGMMINLTLLICAAALVALWTFRRSLLDQWLMVVLLTSMAELSMTGHFGFINPVDTPGLASRFTIGFYAGRIVFSIATSTVVLAAMLSETTKLYAGVSRANMLAKIVGASQTLSSEIKLPRLIERLMTVAFQHAGADRGLLILTHDGDYRVEAEVQLRGEAIALQSPPDPVVPDTIVRHALMTQAPVILDDAAKPNPFSQDPYMSIRGPRSVFCLPLVRHGALGGLLYFENAVAPRVFNPERVRLLELVAAQAFISLENARLYTDLELQVGLLQQLPVSAWTLKPDGTPDFVNQVWLDFSGQTLEFVRSHPEAWMTAVHPEDRESAARTLREAVRSGQGFAFETKSLRARDGVYRRHLQQAEVLRDAEGKVLKFVGTTTDIDDQKRAEETLRRAQADLAHVGRVASLNAMTASIAHEVSQPLSGILTNANTGLRMLAAEPPNLGGVADTVRRTIRDANRASSVIKRLREMFSNKEPIIERVDLNNAARDVFAISAGELERRRAGLQTELVDGLPLVNADRVQLQQVILNLLLNAADAMEGIEDRPRTIVVRTGLESNGAVCLEVRDAGTGFDPATVGKLFEPFHTTKASGMGVGLSICRSIINSHNGRLWATQNVGPGATFTFSIPVATEPAAGHRNPDALREPGVTTANSTPQG